MTALNKFHFMNTISVLKIVSSPLLIASFIFAPVSFATEQMQFEKAPVAAAAEITMGTISGVVREGQNINSNNIGVSSTTLNLYLNDSASLYASTKTDSNGYFVFSAVEGVSYKLEIVPSDGYGISTTSIKSIVVSNLSGGMNISSFLLEKLPEIKIFGGDIVNLKLGQKYEDGGVQLQDQNGKAVSGYGIDAIGNVDVNTVGTYTIKYHLDKEATNGYQVLDKVRYVNVFPSNITITAPTTIVEGNTIKFTNSATTSCTYLNSYLGNSFSNDKLEVLKLQAFLFFKEGMTDVRATGIYDSKTEIAVRMFQDKYYRDILTPWGTEDNTGEVRITTLKKINDIYCGVQTQFTKEQVQSFEYYKDNSSLSGGNIVTTDDEAIDVAEEISTSSIPKKISSWWNNTKKSLIAAFPSLLGGDDKDDEIATGTESEIKIDGIQNSASVAKDGKDGSNMFSTLAIYLAIVLAIFAFGVAVYLYRKTRVPAVVEIVKEVPATAEKKK